MLSKVKAHQRKATSNGVLNSKADLAAKEGARVGPLWGMPDTVQLLQLSCIQDYNTHV